MRPVVAAVEPLSSYQLAKRIRTQPQLSHLEKGHHPQRPQRGLLELDPSPIGPRAL